MHNDDAPTMQLKRLVMDHHGVQHGEEESEAQAWDDSTGAGLDPKEVRRARMKEIGYAREKEVWVKISRKEATKKGMESAKNKIGRHQ